jgi:hypothetical protein
LATSTESSSSASSTRTARGPASRAAFIGKLQRERRRPSTDLSSDRLDPAGHCEPTSPRPDHRPNTWLAVDERTLDDRAVRGKPCVVQHADGRCKPFAIEHRNQTRAVARVIQHGGVDVLGSRDDQILDGERRELGELGRRTGRQLSAHESNARYRQDDDHLVSARQLGEGRHSG